MSDDVLKLKAIGLFKAGHTAKNIARELGVSYPKVCKWKPEAEALETKQDLETVLDADKAILHEVAEGVRDKLDELVDDGGALVGELEEKLDKLQILQVDLQDSGILALEKINRMIGGCNTVIELNSLVDSITKLQNAFFVKGANVNVLNQMGGAPSGDNISLFKSLQRSA